MKKKGWIVVLVLVLLLGLGAGGYFLLSGKSGGSSEATVYVQSVAEILGLGYAGANNQYTGVVEAKDVIKINPDQNMTIEKCFVAAGDPVKEGDVLFRYDVDSLTLAYEQLLIDITGLENTIQTDTEELASLQKQIEKAKPAKLYDLKIKEQTVSLSIKKNEYELKSKRQKAEDTKNALEQSEVKSPVTGTVRSVKENNSQNPYAYYGDDSQSSDYITIVAGTDFCVKGTVSEQTIHSLYEGMPVLVRSRTDKNKTFSGSIYKINTEPEKNNNRYYYDSGSGETASKYAFYVSLDTVEGLLIGQHVFLEPGNDGTGHEEGLRLPEYYLIQENGKAYVYAADSKEYIEKRQVTLGAYDEQAGTYEITDGLSMSDKIAYPNDTVQPGMKASTTRYNDDDENGGNNGMTEPSMNGNSGLMETVPGEGAAEPAMGGDAAIGSGMLSVPAPDDSGDGQ